MKRNKTLPLQDLPLHTILPTALFKLLREPCAILLRAGGVGHDVPRVVRVFCDDRVVEDAARRKSED